eukprot:1867675-Karenia_brevis.AAC.1
MMFYPDVAIFCCIKCTAQLVQRTLVVDTPVEGNASKSQPPTHTTIEIDSLFENSMRDSCIDKINIHETVLVEITACTPQ